MVRRGLIATGPFTSQKLTFFYGMDQVQEDDVLVGDDTAEQWVAGARIGTGETYKAGLYVVSREQETADGKETHAMVYDAYGMVRTPFGKSYEMKVEAEAALVHGTTDLGATPDIPVHDLVQLGAAARLTMNSQSWGTVTDVVYASGDANADDEGVHNFKMDINYEMGMMLYRSILAAQSARTTFYASDPDLVGYPAQNLERTATRGALTNSMAVFPRLWYRVMDGLELYGGPLLAFAEVPGRAFQHPNCGW